MPIRLILKKIFDTLLSLLLRMADMNLVDQIEITLDQLLTNASEIQDEHDLALSSHLLSQQKQLLDRLFEEWDQLDEREKSQSVVSTIENQVLKFSVQNQKCLKK
jgi:hypothetical protein